MAGPESVNAVPNRISSNRFGALVTVNRADGTPATMFIQVICEGGEESLDVTLLDGAIYTAQPHSNKLRIFPRRPQ